MFNWVTPQDENLVLYKGGTAIQRYDQNAASVATLLGSVNGAVAPSFADLDVWTYFTAYNTSGNGTIQAEIYDGVNTDKAFRGPVVLTNGVASDGGAGFCTAGTHYFGVVYQNRTGYAGVPTTSVTFPISAASAATANVTATATVSFVVSATGPYVVQFTVSTTDNGTPDTLGIPGHTYTDGTQVEIDGATGDTAINGVFLVVNSVIGTSLQLTYLDGTPVNGSGVYDANSATITNYNQPDVVTMAGHTFVNGDHVTGAGSQSSPTPPNGDTAINGDFIVVNAIPGTSVQLTDLNGNLIYPNGGYIGGATMTRFGNPETLTLSANPFSNGQPINITGGDEPAIIGNFLVANKSGSTIQLADINTGAPIVGTSVYTTGAVIHGSTIVTATGNNVQTGYTVTISGATGNTAINGAVLATVIVAGSAFAIANVDGSPVLSNGAYTGGGSVMVPIQVTLSASNRQVNVQITLPAQPDGGTDANGGVQATMFLIATPASNQNAWFFIPNVAATAQIGELPVPLNTPTVLNFVMNVSDEDMLASYDSALPNFLFLSQASDGTGPFNPNFVSAYGLRMVYGNGTVCYASELNNPQQISADLNTVIMPNQRKIALAFQLQNSQNMYLTGDRWTAYVTDNGDEPSTWPEPIKVSDTLGAPFANCVAHRTGGNYAWIAVQSGIHYFDGTFADKPLTYLISDYWAGINWSAAYCIEIQDDAPNLKLYVSVPLGSSTVPNVIIVFDYQNGLTFDQVDISIDSFTAKPNLGSICAVKEVGTDKTNLWIGPAAAGNVVHFDPTTLNDDGNVAIFSFWISGLILGTDEMTSQMIRIGSADIWMRGAAAAGTVGVVWRGPDNVTVVTSDLLSAQGVVAALTATPGLMYQTALDFTQIENATFSVGTNALNSWFELSGFRMYYKPDIWNR